MTLCHSISYTQCIWLACSPALHAFIIAIAIIRVIYVNDGNRSHSQFIMLISSSASFSIANVTVPSKLGRVKVHSTFDPGLVGQSYQESQFFNSLHRYHLYRSNNLCNHPPTPQDTVYRASPKVKHVANSHDVGNNKSLSSSTAYNQSTRSGWRWTHCDICDCVHDRGALVEIVKLVLHQRLS